jgi:thiol-disulfide isomerase/thioredoxin
MNFVSVLVIVAMCVPALSAPPAKPQPGSAQEGSISDLKPMLNLKLIDLEGKRVDPDSLKGNIVIMDFWATWCGPCIMEIPEYNLLHKKYAGKGVKVVGVTLASGEIPEVKPFVARFKMEYPVLMGDDDQVYDLNIGGYPTTFLITKDWKIFQTYLGNSPEKKRRLEADLEKLIATAAP